MIKGVSHEICTQGRGFLHFTGSLFSSNLVTPNLTYFISLITEQVLGNLIFCHVKCDGGKVCSNSPIHFLCVLYMTVENRLHVPVVTVVPLEQVICERRSSLYYQLQETYSHAIGHHSCHTAFADKLLFETLITIWCVPFVWSGQ